MCQSGYKDALRFLQENSECLPSFCLSSSYPYLCHVTPCLSAARPDHAGEADLGPRTRGGPGRLLLQAHGDQQGVAAAEAPSDAKAALVDGRADRSAPAHQERCDLIPKL